MLYVPAKFHKNQSTSFPATRQSSANCRVPELLVQLPLNLVSYLDSLPRVSQKPSMKSRAQALCFLSLVLFYLRVSVLTKLNRPCSLSSASLALRVKLLAIFFSAQKKIPGPQTYSNTFRGERFSDQSSRGGQRKNWKEVEFRLDWIVLQMQGKRVLKKINKNKQLHPSSSLPLSYVSVFLKSIYISTAQGNAVIWRPQVATGQLRCFCCCFAVVLRVYTTKCIAQSDDQRPLLIFLKEG